MLAQLRSFLRALRLNFISLPIGTFINRSISRVFARQRDVEPFDLVFVLPPKNGQGWILDAICRELGSRFPRYKISYCRFGVSLPKAERYFFSHYVFFIGSLSPFSNIYSGRSFVFVTHLEPDKHRLSDKLLARLLNRSDGVICMNKQLQRDVQKLGVAVGKTSVVVGAANGKQFCPHKRKPDGKVGFCSAFYERKSPDVLFEIVRSMPHRKFLLLGKGWQAYKRFDQLCGFSNFEYVETAYTEYPEYYSQMSVFVSVSQIEGGPIPLLEAMMSNVVPVASRTGFGPDIIEHGKNGFIFENGVSIDSICRLIEDAFRLDVAIDESVREYTWEQYSQKMGIEMGLKFPANTATEI